MDKHHSRVRAEQQLAKYRSPGAFYGLGLGDFVLVERQPGPGVSNRLMPKTRGAVFQIVEAHGDGTDAKAYTLSDSRVSRNLGFSQPIALERLVPVDLLPLSQVSEDDCTKIAVYQGDEYCEGVIEAQSLDGKVYIRSNDSEVMKPTCVDLASARHRWL